MKIGIGVCSYKRPVLATQVCSQILQTLGDAHRFQTVCSLDDYDKTGYEWIEKNFGLIIGPNKGVAINKNRLLNHLKECEVIFIIEDDIQFYKTGWIDLYLEVIQTTRYHHLNYITSEYSQHIQKIEKFDKFSIGYSKDFVSGVLMTLTKECLKKVGGFDIRFGKYGFEHVNYTQRCMKAGLHPPEYFHVMESSNFISWSPTQSTIPENLKEKFIRKSGKVFSKPIKKIFLPLKEYSQKFSYNPLNLFRSL